MKNTILDFDKIQTELGSTWGTVDVPDYFSKKIHLDDLFSADLGIDINEYLTTFRIADDDKIERISYQLYGTTNYWDILVLLNSKDPLFDLPYNYDLISDNVTNFVDVYKNYIYAHAPLSDDERIDILTNQYLNERLQKTETDRFIKVIKPSKLNEFIKILKDNNYI